MNILDYSVFVFDLDGVIINSELIHFECYKKAFAQIINYNLEWDEYCRVHHSLDTSFECRFPETFKEIYSKKKELYEGRIGDIELVSGFNIFFNTLLKHGKHICIVTDASLEVYNQISEKFEFLKKSNIVITRNSCKQRKPNSECYIHLLNELPPDIENHDIISFEDSYKGYFAASQVIYNCVLVNNNTYIYYEQINAKNKINNFDQILDMDVNIIEYKPFYVSSKTNHKEKWIELKNSYPIIANWIYVNKSKTEMNSNDREDVCDLIHKDIRNIDFGILYVEHNEKDHIGSLIEIGLLLANSKPIYVCGCNLFKDEVLFNFKNYFNFQYVEQSSLFRVFKNIQYNMNSDYKLFLENVTHYKKNIQTEPKKKIFDYVVICASGKGSRLLPLTKHIPKLLVNVDNSNIIEKIINYWSQYTDNFKVIIDSKYNEIVDFYLKLSKITYEIINVDCLNGEENSYTLNKAMSNKKYSNKKILITWCDIYPDVLIPENVFGDENIIFTYKNFGRYDAMNNKIIKKPYGNIIGIYYFASFNHIQHYENTMDICDCYKDNFGDFKTFEIESLTDIGDFQKMCNYIHKNETTYNTRYFNKITELSGNILEKRSTCSYGNSIITNEMLFYKYISLDNIPKIIEYSKDSFKIQKIANHHFIEIFNKTSIGGQFLMIENVLNEIEKIHNLEKIKKSKSAVLEDIKIEFYDKVMQRLENVDQLLHFFNNVKSVNKVPIRFNHKYIIDKLFKNIKATILERPPEYNVIHGDPHMSNILVDSNQKLWFIDPRGYFGNTKIFGLKEYDIAKLIYSLSGFDHINNSDTHFFTIDEKLNIDTNITNNIDNYLHLFEKYDRNLLIDMTILHWFGLTDYSKNNIHKCISSYYYGIYLYHIYYGV